MSKTTNKFSPEVRARAVRMILDHWADYPSRRSAVVSVADKIGCAPQTPHEWPKSDTHNLSNRRFKFGIPDTKHGHRSNKNHSKHIISSYGFAFLPLSESTAGLNRDIVSSLCK